MKDYSEQQLKFVDKYLELSIENENYRQVSQEAKKFAGYGENTPVSTIMKGVKDLIIEEMRLRLAQMAPKLLNGLDSIINEPAIPGSKIKLDAILAGLDRLGVVKVEKSQIEIKTPDGIIILPSKQSNDNKTSEENSE